MSAAISPSRNQPYGVSRVCGVWELCRSAFYAARDRRKSTGLERCKPGPKTPIEDSELLIEIRKILKEAEDLGLRGEGHRKVWARLRHRGFRAGRERVLRLMRENSLLAPTRLGRPRGPRVHDGTITMPEPDLMWGTDATRVWTRSDGLAWVFVAVDHCTSGCVGVHASRFGNRFEALEPIRQGIRTHFGEPVEKIALGLGVRHDHGSQYTSEDFQDELEFFGICSSPSFVRSPEGNGIAERFIKTLKEQLLWVKTFDTIEELRAALLEFQRLYNEHWILERHGFRTPRQVREDHSRAKAA